MHDFYYYLLGVSDTDIQTISWQEIVSRLMTLRDANPATAGAVSARHRKFMGSQSKQRMDAHDIANRLMRKENYLIALINKDILDLTLPIPFLRNKQLFSRTLEWNINLCIMDYVFNEQGQVRTLFLKDTHRKALSEGLRRRFIFAGIMNIFVAPFIVVYFMMHYFFRYFNEYKKNPSQIGSRQYTPLAEWKFREFNELWHLFERRINMSYPLLVAMWTNSPKIRRCRSQVSWRLCRVHWRLCWLWHRSWTQNCSWDSKSHMTEQFSSTLACLGLSGLLPEASFRKRQLSSTRNMLCSK